ncbi:MAG TPA: SCO family protein [Acidimicrobiales bacterium]|nr:SCO family protein [Acidimicrobiales bacterium]
MLPRLIRIRPRRAAAGLAALVMGGTAIAACSSGSAAPPAPPPSQGILQNRPVPSIPMVDEQNQSTTLAHFRGKTVLLTTTLTLCQEMCPLTTENLILIQRAINAAGLANKVKIVEYSVDPDRDTPARLRAYEHLTGASWPILTGTQANVDAMNNFFHFYAQKVPEGSPPQLDWWTHQPLTYDVNHSDGYVLIDPQGHERFATAAAPDVTSHTLPKALDQMLNDQGQRNLNAPTGQTWTVPEVLSNIGWMVKQSIPAAT